MLTVPIPATIKARFAAGLDARDIGGFEVNEAFAPVPLAWLAELGAGDALLNPSGGAIALGHPLGGSGVRLMTTLVHHIRDTSIRYGLMVADVGGGIAGEGASRVPAEEVVAGIRADGGNAVVAVESVARSNGGEPIAQHAIDESRRVDILANNAGIVRERMFTILTDADIDEVLRGQVLGARNVTRPLSTRCASRAPAGFGIRPPTRACSATPPPTASLSSRTHSRRSHWSASGSRGKV